MESTVFNEFAAAREARALARGRLEGEAKGKMEGEIEGRRQALHSMLMRVLKKRWKQEPPADLIQRIEAEENEAKLQSWMDEAVTAKSFAAFRKTAGL